MLQLSLASVAAVYCLLGYWLAFGKQSWLLRAGTLLVALALLVPIRAYEPIVFFALTTLLFLGAAGAKSLFCFLIQRGDQKQEKQAANNSVHRAPAFQFRIHDLLGLMGTIAGTIWLIQVVICEQVLLPWADCLLSAGVAALITGTTMGLLFGPRRILSGLALLTLVGVAFWYFHWQSRGLTLGSPYILLGDSLYWEIHRAHAPMLDMLVIYIVFLAMLAGAARAVQRQGVRPKPYRLWNSLLLVPQGIWLVGVCWLYVQLLQFPLPVPLDLDRPNILPVLLARGYALASQSGVQKKATTDEVIKFSRELGFIHVPWGSNLTERRFYDAYEASYWISTASNVRGSLLAQAEALEADDPDLAAEYLMATLRIGNMLQHDGLIEHGREGAYGNGTRENHLAYLRRRISVMKRKEIIAELVSFEESRDQEQIARDDYWRSLNERWGFQLHRVLTSRFDGNRRHELYLLFSRRSSAMARLLIVDLALREYNDDHGQYPTELSSLTPKYLAKVPYDPFNGQPFVYRPTDKEFVLYSVGGDEKDNGGAFPGRYFAVPPYEGYDLCLDKPFGLRN